MSTLDQAITKFTSSNEPPDDAGFEALLSEEDWKTLSPAIRERFAGSGDRNDKTVYRGVVERTKLNFFGWLIAQFGRLIGCPLPLKSGFELPAIVCVIDSPALGGQVWIRIYGTEDSFPQVIQSAKRFQGPTGLEEYLGYGVGISLNMCASLDQLMFTSDHYFIELFGTRLQLPSILSPGMLEIIHKEEAGKKFRYILKLSHPLFGDLVYQTAIFSEFDDV